MKTPMPSLKAIVVGMERIPNILRGLLFLGVDLAENNLGKSLDTRS